MLLQIAIEIETETERDASSLLLETRPKLMIVVDRTWLFRHSLFTSPRRWPWSNTDEVGSIFGMSREIEECSNVGVVEW